MGLFAETYEARALYQYAQTVDVVADDVQPPDDSYYSNVDRKLFTRNVIGSSCLCGSAISWLHLLFCCSSKLQLWLADQLKDLPVLICQHGSTFQLVGPNQSGVWGTEIPQRGPGARLPQWRSGGEAPRS